MIFDFDGTLAELRIDFDLMRRRVAALAEAFLGEPPASDGQPVLEWMETLAREIGEFDRDMGLEFHSRGRLAVTAMELDASRQGRLFPFTRDLLDDLRRRGVGTAVITRNCTAAVERVFPDIVRHVDVFLARDDVPRVKPDPVHLRTALDRLKESPGTAIMVGDHPLDIDTARRAGTLSGAVASGRIGLDDLRNAAPDFLAEDCPSLLERLMHDGLIS